MVKHFFNLHSMPKMTYTAVYQQPRTLLRYDSERVIIYPDERVEDNFQPEKTADNEAPSPFKAYIYTGEERDGGFIVPCSDPTDHHEVANAIIRTRYTVSDELALQRHHQEDADAYAEEWQAYCSFADAATAKAKKWLGIV